LRSVSTPNFTHPNFHPLIPTALVASLLALGPLVSVGCRQSAVRNDASRATITSVRDLTPSPGALALPLRPGSIRYAVIGDSGRGDQPQHEVAARMAAWRAKFPFDFVLMLGDNIYGPHTADDYVPKFEEPYRALLDAGVTFYAAIGNHDESTEIAYAKFNMGGKRYYTFRRAERRLEGLAGAAVRFFALDSRSFDATEFAWLRDELARSGSAWKICYFHGAGSLHRGDVRPSSRTARGFDRDYHFLMMEISGDDLFFQAISRAGETVDAGVITRKAAGR
jgi:Calcineurin-like phosphoesterase